jgi:hypothetical protein
MSNTKLIDLQLGSIKHFEETHIVASCSQKILNEVKATLTILKNKEKQEDDKVKAWK